MSAEQPRVVFVGNPNTGKSTLFNRVTGSAAHVSNVPGTTVSRTDGRWSLPGGAVECVDVPGTYSLAAHSADERVALDAIIGLEHPTSALVVVLDAPRLARSLYLALQVLELGTPVVCALNLMDEARTQGRVPSAERLAELLGVPVVPVVGRTGEGLDALGAAVWEVIEAASPPPPPHEPSDALRADALAAADSLPEAWTAGASEGRRVALGLWALLSDDGVEAIADVAIDHVALVGIRRRAEDAGRDLMGEVVGHRYAWIDRVSPSLYSDAAPVDHAAQDRVDRILLHPLWGSLVFAAVMFVVFQTLFSWSGPLVDGIDGAFGWLGDVVAGAMAAATEAATTSAGPAVGAAVGFLGDLLVEGIIGGVGSVLVFIPQIGLLFLFISLLEDSGYLARAAHLMDRILRLAGLPGQAFVPLLSGYACAVPAVMATRSLPRHRDRLLTMLVVPLTSCSARLPVYVLLVAALFPETVPGLPVSAQALALFTMYALSTVVSVLAAVVLGRLVVTGTAAPALLELPPYRWPHPPNVWRSVKNALSAFVTEAGQVILVATIVLWGLLSFPRYEPTELLSPDTVAEARAEGVSIDDLAQTEALRRSYAGQLGRAMEPVIAPLGYDWKIGIGLLGSFAAREVFVSTMGLVYGIGDDAAEDDVSLHEKLHAEKHPDGRPVYTPLTGASLMVFFAFAMQCLSTLAVLRRETESWRWPAFATAYMMALAWVSAFAVYQGGRLLGFG
mgnify:FL=1